MRFHLLFFIVLHGFALGEPPAHKKVVVVQSKKIDENSGIDLSNRYPDSLWTHNDSGSKPYLYLVSLKTGETIATLYLKGIPNRDWEDIVTFQKDGKPFIAIADTGDNLRFRSSYQISIIEEPEIDINAKTPPEIEITEWRTLRYTYEDGRKDCESLGIDLINNQFILVEKIFPAMSEYSGVYQLDYPLKDKLDAKAKRIGTLRSKNYSAMDISNDGSTMIARAYHMGFVFRRDQSQTWEQTLSQPMPEPIIFPMQRQGEGVCFTPDGKSVFISTEKKKQPIFKVKLPEPIQ